MYVNQKQIYIFELFHLPVVIFLKPIETLDGVYTCTHALTRGKYRHIPRKWVT